MNPKFPPQAAHYTGMVMIGPKDRINLEDVAGQLEGPNLDVIIESPGGMAEVAEGIGDDLRSRFDHIRVFVPGMAKSAATILSMMANEIWLDDSAELGPTDPQMPVNGRYSPAGAILAQFDLAQDELKRDPAKLPAWIPVLQQCGPSILIECRNAIELSINIMSRWLREGMFRDDVQGPAKASEIAGWLSNDTNFQSHGRRIAYNSLADKGLKVFRVSENPALQAALREYYFALLLTFERTGLFKTFENSTGSTTAYNFAVEVVQGVSTAPTEDTPAAPPEAPSRPAALS